MKIETHNNCFLRVFAALAVTPLMLSSLVAEIVTLTPTDIHGGDTSTTEFNNADVTLTPLQGGTPATFNANVTRLGIDDFATNANAFNDPDIDPNNGNEEQLRFEFAATAGLTGLSWDFARADGPNTQSGVNISGFATNPGASVTGPGASVSYANGTLNIQLTAAAFVATQGTLTLANSGASAGATLLMTVTDTTQAGSQFPIRSISYEDEVATKAPVIDTPLPATLEPVVGLQTTLSVGLEPGTVPAPTFLWEYDGGSGYVTVGSNETYTFTAGPATDGAYRVTVTNTFGSDTSSTVVSAVDGLVDSGRNSIGITFAATTGDGANINLGPITLAGAPGFVQKNWNATSALTDTPLTATAADIISPSSATLVDSSGAVVNTGFTVTASGAFSRLNNPQISAGGLFSGYLFTNQDTSPVLIDLNDIPYSRYDVVLYVMGFNRFVRGTLEEVNSGQNLEYSFRTPVILAAGESPNWFRSADQTIASNGSNPNFPVSTHVVFRGLTGPIQSFDLNRILDNPGIAAIQIVEDLDTDGDGMGDFYEISVGLDPDDNGSTDPLQAPDEDLDGDTLSNIFEHDNGTNPTLLDTDGDGINDNHESDTGTFISNTNTGTDPRMADTDGDGLLDGVETNTGVFVDADNTGTNPLVAETDFDQDGWSNVYEIETGLTDHLDPNSPGGPNPNGFAIAFNAAIGQQGGENVPFGPLVHAGAPGREQKNWNRTIDLANTPVDASGDITKIGTPTAGSIVDSSGTVIGNGSTGVGVTFDAGRGAYSAVPEGISPYGRLFNSFIFGTTQTADPSWSPDTSVTLTGIPYSNYDVYVYFGSESNNRIGTITSSTAGVTYSFTTRVNSGSPGSYLQTTDTGNGNPQANYAVFSSQSTSTFDVTLTVGGGQNSMGIYGIQVVDTGEAGGPSMVLHNPQKSGNTFTADFTTDTAGTYIFERSLNLDNPWDMIGPAFGATPGTMPLTDPNAPAGKAFYRVRKDP